MVDTASLVSGCPSTSSSPRPVLSGLCKPRFFLDIFSGARMPVSTACKRFSVDMFDPVDLIHGWDILDDDVFHSLLCLGESGLVGAALAAPYCCKHSRATLRRPGPRPVRTPEYLDGLPDNTVQQQLAVQESATVHDRARHLLSAVARSNGLIILENPSSSMTWLDDCMQRWVHATAPFAAHASACKFGTNWAKTWCFVSNKPDIFAVAQLCDHGPHSHESVIGVRLPDGSFKSRLTAEYPEALAATLAQIIHQFTTCSDRQCPLDSWSNLLPPKLAWPLPGRRVEDGGGLTSSALCPGSLSIQPWPLLRKRWFQRLCDSKHCFKIVANIQQGLPDPPLSQDELQPYLDDLLEVFHLQDAKDLITTIVSGQPCRLNLWQHLVSSWNAPDTGFFDLLKIGVRLGVNRNLPPSPAWPSRPHTAAHDEPLIECSSAWKSALDHHDLVEELVAAEVADGFVAPVPGGLDALRQQYDQVAVGKLGVVLAEGRSPRLVVDSSVSNVTANTCIPNHMLLPKVSDLMDSAPPTVAQEQLIQLTLDVSKAHRRILIHPDDRGLLCFHVGERLYQCLCLNFGARVSGWYWGRVAGLMVRTSHALLDHHHALWQYVDDLLAWLDRQTAPLWASALIILFLILGIPMSWHKAALDTCLTWIGWQICLDTWTVQIPDTKLLLIQTQLAALTKTSKVSVKDLQSAIGRLLWLTGAWHHLRPLLIPLYKALSQIPTTMVGVSPPVFQQLQGIVDDDLFLQKSMLSQHHSLVKGARITRVANTHVTDHASLQTVHIKTRRVWLGVTDPDSPHRTLDDNALAAITAWQEVMQASSFCIPLRRPSVLPVVATADAMATATFAGFGGAVSFNDSTCIWFQFRIQLDEAQASWSWVTDSMQKHIAAWELLTQFALTYCVVCKLPAGHEPVTCHQGTDNSATDASASKGLSMTPAMAEILCHYFIFMRRSNVFADITHVPGYQNQLADALSRYDDLPQPLDSSAHQPIDWRGLTCQKGIAVSQPEAKWPSSFRVRPT